MIIFNKKVNCLDSFDLRLINFQYPPKLLSFCWLISDNY